MNLDSLKSERIIPRLHANKGGKRKDGDVPSESLGKGADYSFEPK